MNQKSLLFFTQSCKTAKLLRVIDIFQKQYRIKNICCFSNRAAKQQSFFELQIFFRYNNESKILVFQTELQNGKASSSYRYFSEIITNQKSLFFKQSCKMAKFLQVIDIFSETIMNQKSLFFKQSCKMAKLLRVIDICQKQ